MNQSKPLLLLFCSLVMVTTIFMPSSSHATVSTEFFRQGTHIYDDWGVFRTRATGTNGFLGITATSINPVITQEGLGPNAEKAWRLGQEFARKYPDRHQRAERIFYFVRDRVSYTSDSDQFKRGEYAQNADEMMAAIVDDGIAQGDCEDSSILLAVMYKGAGYRSAMVLSPGHVATLVHLPKYQHAPRKLAIGNESGWVWAEATGATNRFGWMPGSANSQELVAREVAATELNPKENTKTLVQVENGVERNKESTSSWTGMVMFFSTTGILWLATSRRRVSKRL